MIKILITILIFIISTFFQSTLFAQDTIVSYPSFELFVSTSYASGLRIGGRYYMIDNISVESSIGQDVVNLFSPSDNNFRGSIGINYHIDYNSKLYLNATYAQIINMPMSTTGYIISFNIGSLPLIKKGIGFYYSGGIWLKKLFKIKAYYLLPNFELGLFHRF